ncbi:MAG: nitric oxide-sensing protein NosP [Alcanivorax sediminis]|uniref:GfdT protein n=1 Tax=Alcanivorax sediminis TaxID=2663008 RepID=A0A6N7M1N8_9GAMM|nr:nitric oxide-sensing protein NosP [Alcanivorax sediminis]MQX54401.1 GfdT protein [Alcanivorax sediminis]
MNAAPANAVLTSFSSATDEYIAADELASSLVHPNLGFVLFFCSVEYDLDRLAQALQSRFQNVPISGCTSCGEITSQGYDRGSIVAIGFDRRFFTVGQRLIEQLERFDLADAQQLTDSLFAECSHGVAGTPNTNNTFVLTLMDGLSVSEEMVLATLNAVLGSITCFGGSAGDEYRLNGTYVYSNGRFCRDAAIVLMVSTQLDFEVLSTHHLSPQSQKLVVTDSDPEQRRVLSLNAEPAAQAYARLVGVPVEELDDVTFACSPLAVRINGRYYARAIQRVNPDMSLSFYCAVENGIVLTAMETGSILNELDEKLGAIESRLGPAWLTLGCDCCLRYTQLEAEGLVDAASALLRRYGVIGFSTYGEHVDGMHLNHTFTGVVIGRKQRL